VGLEVHAQIQTESKLFSGSGNRFAAPANSLVSLFDCAIPGSLPVLNRKCVEAAIMTGLALSCQINLVSEFDRKHYFYADMPAGYQITQQRLPLASDGSLDFVVYNPAVNKTPYQMKSAIKQLQLEQDSGKSLHDEVINGSLIDLNRAGVGLMEIVFEPDLSNGDEAVALVGELINILSVLQTCDCKMEEGSLRVDANVSVNETGGPLGTRTEIKNLNSLRSVARSIDYEIRRHIQILEANGRVVNETRGYDPQLKRTVSMRDKETKQDYRFMPEPNLPPLRLLQLGLEPSRLRSKIPTLPKEERRLIMDKYKLNLETTVQLVSDQSHLKFFKNVMNYRPSLPVKLVCNFFLTELLGLLNKDGASIDRCCVTYEAFAQTIELLHNGSISQTAAKELLVLIYRGDSRSPGQIVEDKGWRLINDDYQLEAICHEVLNANEKHVAAYRAGKVKVLNSLVGQLKKSCNNRFDMCRATETLQRLLDA